MKVLCSSQISPERRRNKLIEATTVDTIKKNYLVNRKKRNRQRCFFLRSSVSFHFPLFLSSSYNHTSSFLHVTHSARLLPCVVLFRVLLAGGRVLERALQEVFGICSQHSFSEAVFLRRERSPLTLQALKQPRSSSASEHSQRRGEGSCCCDVCRGKPASGED